MRLPGHCALCLAIALLPLATACGQGYGQSYPRPLTAAQMAQFGTGAALVQYLGQPGATPSVCSRPSRGPHVGRMSAGDFSDLTAGLLDSTVPPDLWGRCAPALFADSTTAESAQFLDAMGRAYRTLLRGGEPETRSSARRKLGVLHAVFLTRPPAVQPSAGVMTSLVDDLRDALDRQKLGPVSTAFGRDLLAVLDLERGTWQGRAVTLQTLDETAARDDEARLRLFSLRLPDPELRLEAKRRIVRLHIAASNWPEVQEHAAEVESTVLATGHNAVDLAQHPPLGAAVDRAALSPFNVLARQDVDEQTVTLLAYGGTAPGISIIPDVDLRRALQIQVSGVSRSVSLCAATDDLSVTPCLSASEVKIDSPLAFADADGVLHFVDHVSTRQAVSLAADGPLSVPVKAAGTLLLALRVPVYFERPSDFVFRGSTGSAGPNVRVAVEWRGGQRLVFTIDTDRGPRIAVVEQRDASRFAVVSRGGDGSAGDYGRNGADGIGGSPGASASCPGGSGGNGTDGGPGENGGPGGDGGSGGSGGDIQVHMTCNPNECGPLVALLKRIVRSEGGAGGPGGQGGRGGRGGSGGPAGGGAMCTDSNGSVVTVPGGLGGHDGSSGTDGSPGSSGRDGEPGRVVFTTAGPGR